MTQAQWLIPLAAFAAVFVFALVLVQTFTGLSAARVRQRLREIRLEGEESSAAPLIRARYLRNLTPLERRLEELPGMSRIERLIEQAGYHFPAYRLALLAAACAAGAAAAGGWLSAHAGLAAVLAIAGGGAPFLQMVQMRTRRLREFEADLPDALDMMARALRAGNPLAETFKFVAEEMEGPIAQEMATTWSHLNYGVSLKASFDDMIARMPSMSLRAMATAILVQRETGGNLAEILDKIAAVLRARFRFLRRVRSLSAEGRISAWVLILMPFALAATLALTSPTYLPRLTGDPLGRTLIVVALALMALGVVWIQRVIRVRM